jgi:hypothetical protein
MISLREFLTQEGFNQRNKLSMETKEIISTSLPLPSSNSNDQQNIDCSNQKFDKTSTEMVCSASEKSNLKSSVSPDSIREGPPMDAVAIRALVSIIRSVTILEDISKMIFSEKQSLKSAILTWSEEQKIVQNQMMRIRFL